MKGISVYLSAVMFIISFPDIEGVLRRCYQCRSRGDLGSCKDPFKFNVTQIENEHGITAVPCASGWCGKLIEGEGTLRDDDYDMATQRMCVQRGPSDSEDRCAHTVYNFKKVYMCFCQGDLCNSAVPFVQSPLLLLSLAAVVLLSSSTLRLTS